MTDQDTSIQGFKVSPDGPVPSYFSRRYYDEIVQVAVIHGVPGTPFMINFPTIARNSVIKRWGWGLALESAPDTWIEYGPRIFFGGLASASLIINNGRVPGHMGKTFPTAWQEGEAMAIPPAWTRNQMCIANPAWLIPLRYFCEKPINRLQVEIVDLALTETLIGYARIMGEYIS